MKFEYNASTRLLEIIKRLEIGDRLSLKNLSDEFEVSLRTIQRDFKNINDYLIPIEKDDENQYYLTSSNTDNLNINDIKNFAKINDVEGLYPNLDKQLMGKILDKTITETYIIKGHNYEDTSIHQKYFNIFEESILCQNFVSFTYKNQSRIIAPYKLMNIKGIWYLAGTQKRVSKNFHIMKISKLKRLNDTFVIDEKVLKQINDGKNLWLGEKKEVVLKVSKNVSEYFTRRDIIANQTLIKTLETGELLISTQISYDEEILKIVRYWIPNVDIVSPLELQIKLKEGLKEYLGKE